MLLMADNYRIRQRVLSVPIDVIKWIEVEERIIAWAQKRQSRYVCICNVHSVVTADNDLSFFEVILNSDLATPDGMPIAWMLRVLGFKKQERINGPDLLWRLCGLLPQNGISVFFYGGAEETLKKLRDQLLAAFPTLKIAGMVSPPFRALSQEEDDDDVRKMNDSGAGIVFVGLGCPKQERWMASHRGRINAVMIGVGAALDYHAGSLKRAPLWMQKSGIEWFFRLIMEPRRLLGRYLVTNSLFVFGAIQQIFFHRRKNCQR